MKYSNILFFLIFFTPITYAQQLTGEALLAKSIQYHDSKDNWEKWNPTFILELEMADRPSRTSEVTIDNKHGDFYLKVQQDSHLVERIMKAGKCSNLLDGKTTEQEDLIEKHRLTCERTQMYQNYYTYLYGLPMKLRDEGTIIHETIEKSSIAGKEYWKLKVTYEESVGKDIWYFYFDQTTFALKAYQFYHDESKNDGEYILLVGEAKIDGIIVPKDRTWYYNKNNKLLGTDYMKE